MKPNFRVLKNRFQRIFTKENLVNPKFIFRALSFSEKVVLGVLVIFVIFAGLFLWRAKWLKNSIEVPKFGGVYTEGMVGEAKDLDKHLARLTGAGLTRLEENGDVKGDIAESWEILDEGKTYRFKLRSGFNPQDLSEQLKAKNIWSNIEVAIPSDNQIDFKFKQPFSPFLYISTEPVFPYGPYKIIQEQKGQIALSAQDNYWRGKPNIEKLVFRLYPDEIALNKAMHNHELNGFIATSKEGISASNYQVFDMPLPRETILFFNLNKDPLKNLDLRKNLRDGKALDGEQTFDLATSDNDKNLKIAETIKSKWAPLKVNINIKKYDNITLQKDIIPKKQYDLLLYGLDYGPDPDPYPFWHSSQIKPEGMNLSNFSNKSADKLLEEARQTFDFAVREDKYNQFKKILDEQIPFISLNRETLYYYLSNKVKGVEKIFGSAETDRFLNIDKWYIKSKRVKK
jgi:ABC-type transport system substrate-binding protein